MTFNWSMPAGLKAYYSQELEKYRTELALGNLQVAWRHLERAHSLGYARRSSRFASEDMPALGHGTHANTLDHVAIWY